MKMKKFSATSIFTMFASLGFIAVTAGASFADQPNSQWGNGPKWGTGQSKKQPGALPESQKLIQNDNMIPTLNRTEALRKEGEDGNLWPAADEALKPEKKYAMSSQHVAKRQSKRTNKLTHR